jgi:hypothetical protein
MDLSRSSFPALAGVLGLALVQSAFPAAQVGSTGAPRGIRACALLSKPEIKAIAGAHTPRYFDEIPSVETALPGGGSECAFGGFRVELDAVPASEFESTRQKQQAQVRYEAVSGVGDEAYFYEQGPPGSPRVVGVYGRVGERVFLVSMDVGAEDTAALLRPAIVELARAGAPKLR